MHTRGFARCPYDVLRISIALFLLSSGASPVAAQTDIVLYASDVTTTSGNWGRVASTSGAGGQLMSSRDAGEQTAEPIAAPRDYFEVSFTAKANTPYRVWLRLRAAAGSPRNDSVWVQFSGSLSAAGTAAWRIGSRSALLVNLEDCSGCGVAGWGWQDDAWWTGQYPVVAFASTGVQTLRVQTREDGVQIDQIVLSPRQYFWSSPGLPTGDRTIVPKPPTGSSLSPEVVLYATDAVRLAGNWRLEPDAKAALGQRLSSRDHGWKQGASALASPADFVEWRFNAVAGLRYRVWVRLRAAGNLRDNDSLWMQFSNAVDASGARQYAIGTTSALPLALERCAGCPLSSWGWQGGAWWTQDTGVLTFATSGLATLRIQTREDGVRIDQIVLSPVRYTQQAPGAATDDRTLVRRDGTHTAIW